MSGIAMVTGAGSGIGRAATLALLADGWSVVLAGRRAETLAETASLSGAAERTLCAPTDVTKPAEVEALFEAVRQRFGRLDLLFNNAGGNVPAANFGDVTYEQWCHVVSVNFNGCFLVAHAAFRMMRDQAPQGGRIINNGSISAHRPRPGAAPYTSTKHGISGLTKTISLDGRKYDIACGQIDIGNAATPLTRRMAGGVIQPDGSMRPEPTMDVADVGRAIAFMASLPLEANVQSMMITASKMPFMGRG
jgi:NAD(P)-dependent dehydrogenase (short-subunit alcohol dehydrogenase family)